MKGRLQSLDGVPKILLIPYSCQRLRLTCVEKVQFIGLAANAVREKERIALQPGNLLARVFEADSGTGHDGVGRRTKIKQKLLNIYIYIYSR